MKVKWAQVRQRKGINRRGKGQEKAMGVKIMKVPYIYVSNDTVKPITLYN
jgi:hypothetical protein